MISSLSETAKIEGLKDLKVHQSYALISEDFEKAILVSRDYDSLSFVMPDFDITYHLDAPFLVRSRVGSIPDTLFNSVSSIHSSYLGDPQISGAIDNLELNFNKNFSSLESLQFPKIYSAQQKLNF